MSSGYCQSISKSFLFGEGDGAVLSTTSPTNGAAGTSGGGFERVSDGLWHSYALEHLNNGF
jgi:hypothetical protein